MHPKAKTKKGLITELGKREMRKQMIETTAVYTPYAPWCSVNWRQKVLHNKCRSLSQNLISYSRTPQASSFSLEPFFIFRNLWLMTQGNKSWREKTSAKKGQRGYITGLWGNNPARCFVLKNVNDNRLQIPALSKLVTKWWIKLIRSWSYDF